MRAVDLIQKKQKKQELSTEEFDFLLLGYLKGEVPDYQISAFLMAVYFNGMSDRELDYLTLLMSKSGKTIRVDSDQFIIDKHSSGGVGDKTTIALSPLLASLDMAVVKLTGQGLGHTGGTTDKYESITGFKFPASLEEMSSSVFQTGVGMMSYSEEFVPLDKKLYTLRDVTATVQSIPLIASSIMSKKLAVHSNGIILDVKVGSGAFMKTVEDATLLAKEMIRIGKSFDRKMVAILSNMDQPLGWAVGNSLEVIEAIETLRGNGPPDFTGLIHTLGALALQLKGEVSSLDEGRKRVKEKIADGSALDAMRKFITHSGGDASLVDDYSKLPVSDNVYELPSEQAGVVSHINAEKIGQAAMVLGAGRSTKEDSVDHSVGIFLKKKLGDQVEMGEPIAKLYYQGYKSLDQATSLFKSAYCLEKSTHSPIPGSPISNSPIIDIIT